MHQLVLTRFPGLAVQPRDLVPAGWKSHPIIVIAKAACFPASLIFKPKYARPNRAFALMQSLLFLLLSYGIPALVPMSRNRGETCVTRSCGNMPVRRKILIPVRAGRRLLP